MWAKWVKGVYYMVTDAKQTYSGDRIVMSTNIELLYCTPKTNMLYTYLL